MDYKKKQQQQQQFVRDMEGKDKNNTWKWMRKKDLKRCTEASICSA